MDTKQALEVLDVSWSREKIMKEIKEGKNADEIVSDFIKSNKIAFKIVNESLKENNNELLDNIETLSNCEIKVIKELKKSLPNKNNTTQKDIHTNKNKHKKADFISLSIFMQKWSNKFVIGLLIAMTLISLTKQAWA